MRNILYRIVFAIFIATPCLASAGQLKTILVGVEDMDYRPYAAWIDGVYVGAAADIFNKFASDRGYQIIYRPLSVKRLYQALFDGAIDLKYPDSPEWLFSARKDLKITYSNPVLDYTDGIMVLPQHAGVGIGALKSLAMVSGFTPPYEIQRLAGRNITLDDNFNGISLVRYVMSGRADGGFISVVTAQWILTNTIHKPDGLKYDPDLPHQIGAYMMSTTTKPEVVADFNDWMSKNGRFLEDTKKRWSISLEN